MKKYTNFGLLALLLAVTLALASCAGAGPDDGEQGSGEQGGGESADGMQGMDNDDMDSGGMMDASEMLMEDGEYSDERFIDAMALHHQGAVEMAQVALVNAEHPELGQLAEDVIADQSAEIEQLRAIKEREFGSSDLPTEMNAEGMEMMGMMEDPGELANKEPFDKAFIDEMISHHVAAIQMARVAQENTGDDEIREVARGIVELQESEIEQMTGWRREWYPGES